MDAHQNVVQYLKGMINIKYSFKKDRISILLVIVIAILILYIIYDIIAHPLNREITVYDRNMNIVAHYKGNIRSIGSSYGNHYTIYTENGKIHYYGFQIIEKTLPD